jgi:hypothetical protein
MSLTLAEIVRAPHLHIEVLAEGDLRREVRWVHATDQPQPAPYLRGGEVVLTDGLWLAGGTTPEQYVRGLAGAGAAGIGFGLVPGGPSAPQELVDACRRHDLTLFVVPVEVPFLAISELFVDRAIRDREEPLLRSLQRGERLLHALSGDGGAAGVLAVLAAELQCDAWLCDRLGGVIAGTGGDSPEGSTAHGDDGGASLGFPIPGPAAAGAYLCLRRSGGPLSVDERTAIDQALAVLGIDAAHREALRQAHRRFAAELFELARDGEAEAPAIARRLRDLGLDPDGGLIAIACDVPGAEERLADFESALAAAGAHAVATLRAGRLLAVAEWEPGAPTDGLCAAVATAMVPEAAVGVGAVVAHGALLDASVADARRACRLARLRQDGARGATAAELTSHAGLLAQQDPDLLEHFWRGLLAGLEEHDAARGSELLPTLEAFLSSGGRWAQTASALHVHVNTLRHRLARVEALTGRRLDDPDDRVDLHLALRVRRRLRETASRSPSPGSAARRDRTRP